MGRALCAVPRGGAGDHTGGGDHRPAHGVLRCYPQPVEGGDNPDLPHEVWLTDL
jgi:hypothetical protein